MTIADSFFVYGILNTINMDDSVFTSDKGRERGALQQGGWHRVGPVTRFLYRQEVLHLDHPKSEKQKPPEGGFLIWWVIPDWTCYPRFLYQREVLHLGNRNKAKSHPKVAFNMVGDTRFEPV
ncbi:hypothetical protein, partial [Gallaecimonas pentaromativorans]|uniref:hypothetical protein n=1 Tax=Gallaecimonas pentaromativorans TaxID=584787 RepID=UPI00067F0656